MPAAVPATKGEAGCEGARSNLCVGTRGRSDRRARESAPPSEIRREERRRGPRRLRTGGSPEPFGAVPENLKALLEEAREAAARGEALAACACSCSGPLPPGLASHLERAAGTVPGFLGHASAGGMLFVFAPRSFVELAVPSLAALLDARRCLRIGVAWLADPRERPADALERARALLARAEADASEETVRRARPALAVE